MIAGFKTQEEVIKAMCENMPHSAKKLVMLFNYSGSIYKPLQHYLENAYVTRDYDERIAQVVEAMLWKGEALPQIENVKSKSEYLSKLTRGKCGWE